MSTTIGSWVRRMRCALFGHYNWRHLVNEFGFHEWICDDCGYSIVYDLPEDT